MQRNSISLYSAILCLMCLIALHADAYATGSSPMRIILRQEWEARQPISKEKIAVRPAPYVVVHHSATKSCFTEAKCKQLVKSFQDYHMDVKKWNDIGYNFVIGEDGNVYEGRGWGIRGSHATRYNGYSMGICFTGTFTDHMPNAKAMDALEKLINYGVQIGEIKDDYRLIGHRQAQATDCPGQTLYEALQRSNHWEPHPIDPR